MSADALRVLPVGDAAALVELGHAIDPATNARTRALDAALLARPFDGLRESVPAYASVLVCYDPARTSFTEVVSAVRERASAAEARVGAPSRHVFATAYGGAAGPDLAEVARRAGLSEADVVRRHTEGEYTAFFVGFLPGFAYLGPLPAALDTPRRATPRPRVPAGAVAIAGRQTGVYPFASPGGWNLVGRTAARLFSPGEDPPALVRPGDHVRFTAVPEAELPPEVPVGGDAAPSASEAFLWGERIAEVVDGGLLTTVQDGGRPGHRRWGVPWGGAMDRRALARANRAVGNRAGAAVLECAGAGPALRFLAATRFAVAGADLGAVLERTDLGVWPVPMGAPVVARPGNVLRFTGRRAGLFACVAFRGGVDVPVVLGSRSTDLAGGFGGHRGRALRPGDLLRAGAAPAGAETEALDRGTAPPASVTVRVIAGPQDGQFTEEARARFFGEAWAVGALSDRIGCRLVGPVLAHAGGAEIVTDGMVPGCVQVPPDGQPIVMMADCPTTGGYPKIATVVTADLPLLAQLFPGEGRVRFAPLMA